MSRERVNKALSALKKVDFNINMFESYKATDYVTNTLINLRAQKQELLRYAKEEIEYEDLTYESKMWMFEMPAWGYKGT